MDLSSANAAALRAGAAGTINMTNTPGFTTIEYFTKANGSVAIIKPVAGLTVNVFDETTAAENLTVGGSATGAPIPPGTPTGPTGLNDALTVFRGQCQPRGYGRKGRRCPGRRLGYEQYTLTAKGGGPVGLGTADDLGGTLLMPTLGGNEVVTINGDTTLLMAVTHSAFGARSDRSVGRWELHSWSYRRGKPRRYLHRRHDPRGSGDGCWWPRSRQRHRRFAAPWSPPRCAHYL